MGLIWSDLSFGELKCITMVLHFGYHIMTDKKARKQQAEMILLGSKKLIHSLFYLHIIHMSVTICVTLLWHQCGCFSSAVFSHRPRSSRLKLTDEPRVQGRFYETMIKDISKWIFTVVECIAQRLVNKEVLLTRVCGTWVEVRDKLDSSQLPREEGRPQCVC